MAQDLSMKLLKKGLLKVKFELDLKKMHRGLLDRFITGKGHCI